MKNVSQAFTDAVYSTVRRTKAYITFPFVDPLAKDVEVFEQYPAAEGFGKIEQSTDNIYAMVGKVATFEPDYWKLDGSYLLPLSNSTSQYGYWTHILSDDQGNYPENSVVRIFFEAPISIPGLTIQFDTLTGNYLSEFDLIAYNEDMTELRREEVRGSTQAKFVTDHGVQALKYIDIVFLKSSLPYRRVRITEIDFGITLYFSGDNLFSCNLVSECDPLSKAIPDNELNVTAENDGSFAYTNPESYAKYIQNRQQLVYQHSVVLDSGEEETVDMGAYSIHDWKVSDSKVEFKAKQALAELEVHNYRRSSLLAAKTAGALIEDILDDAGWKKYRLDAYLYDSPTIVSYTGPVTGKEALRMVAQYAGAIVLKMPDGTIVVTRTDFDNEGPELTYDNVFKAPSAKTTTYYNCIEYTVSVITGKAIDANTSPVVEYTDTVDGQQDFQIQFDAPLMDANPTITIVGATLVQSEIFSNCGLFTISGSGSFTLTVLGVQAEINTVTEIVYAPWYQSGEALYAYPISLPFMIQNETFVQVRNWCTEQVLRVLRNRLEVDLEWRQNPSLDIGDYAGVQLDKQGIGATVMYTKHSLSYKGGVLRGTSRAIGQGLEGTT